jgi:tetratricopeptide repeat protein
VLSCDYLTSVYGGAEWHAAWDGDPEGAGRKLLTVRVADCGGLDPGTLPSAGRADLFGLSEGTAMTRLRLMASTAIAGRPRPQAPPRPTGPSGFPGPARAMPRAARFPGKLPRVAGLDRDTGEAIAEQLGRLPLALEQAAAWLDRSRMPGLEYLDLLRRRHAGSGASARTGDRGGPIATLWDISADRVGAESHAAVQLLSVCACLASAPVPLDLFTAHAELLPEPLSSAAADPLAFADVLTVLTGYALATTGPAGLELHDLVRAAVRARDSDPAPAGAGPDPLALALWLLRVDAPAEIHGSPRSWPRWAALVPHVLAATSHAGWQLDPTALEDTAWLLDRAAAYLHVQGRLPEAKTLHERALLLDEAIYGPDHPAVAMRLDALAQVLRDLGQLD